MRIEELSADDRSELLWTIAHKKGTASQIAEWYSTTPGQLRMFVAANREALEAEASRPENATDAPESLSPTQLADLWITNKFERLKRYQTLADALYDSASNGKLSGADLATTVREFRSYLALAANELGQLLHRGSGDSGQDSVLSVEIAGVDMEALR